MARARNVQYRPEAGSREREAGDQIRWEPLSPILGQPTKEGEFRPTIAGRLSTRDSRQTAVCFGARFSGSDIREKLRSSGVRAIRQAESRFPPDC